MRHWTAGRIAPLVVAILAVLVEGSACVQPDHVLCQKGDDPMPDWSFSVGTCDPREYCNEDVTLLGDATVMAVTSPTPGAYSFELYFPDADKTALFDLSFPDAVPLPFAEGDVVEATISVETPWWTSVSATIRDQAQRLLLSLRSEPLRMDDYKTRCERSECGARGYPTLTRCHPDSDTDPAAPCGEVREGEKLELRGADSTYIWYVESAYVYVTMRCFDVAGGWIHSLAVRREGG